jgi:hypothetical protein
MGYLSEEMKAGRIACHGKITSLANGFKLKDGGPFSLFIIPNDGSTTPVKADAKLADDAAVSECPFAVNGWTETLVLELPANAIDLTTHAVYWGSPEKGEAATLE